MYEMSYIAGEVRRRRQDFGEFSHLLRIFLQSSWHAASMPFGPASPAPNRSRGEGMRIFLSVAALAAIVSGCAESPSRPPTVTYDAHYWLQQDCDTVPEPVKDVCVRYHVRAGLQPEQPTTVKTEWATVPCDIVVENRRAECQAEHERLGIDLNKSVSQAATESSPPDAPKSCGYAGNGYRPIVDTEGVDPEHYECDLADCQSYAARINPAANAAGGAVAGALLGAAIGALFGDRSSFARYGAGVGAVQGGVSAGAESVAARANVVRNCMAGRGYRVLE